MMNGLTREDAERSKDAIRLMVGNDPKFVSVGIGKERVGPHETYVVMLYGSWSPAERGALEVGLRQAAAMPVVIKEAQKPVAQRWAAG